MYNKYFKKNLKQDFKNVISSLLKQLFEVNLNNSIKRIYIDLNSAISIIFHYEDLNDSELITITKDAIEKFLISNLKYNAEIFILFSTKPSLVHTSIYPDWCKEREARVNLSKSDFIKNLLVAFKQNETKLNLKIINTDGIHPAVLVYNKELTYASKSVVLSRDNVFRCLNLTLPNVILYNGREWITFENVKHKLPDHIELEYIDLCLPYYYVMRGDKRNEYKGLPGYSVVRSVNYIKQYKLSFIAKLPHPKKIEIDKYLPLYDMKKMLDKTIELKLPLKETLSLME